MSWVASKVGSKSVTSFLTAVMARKRWETAPGPVVLAPLCFLMCEKEVEQSTGSEASGFDDHRWEKQQDFCKGSCTREGQNPRCCHLGCDQRLARHPLALSCVPLRRRPPNKLPSETTCQRQPCPSASRSPERAWTVCACLASAAPESVFLPLQGRPRGKASLLLQRASQLPVLGAHLTPIPDCSLEEPPPNMQGGG